MHPIIRPLRLRIRLIPDTFELISLRPCVICLEMLSIIHVSLNRQLQIIPLSKHIHTVEKYFQVI